MIAIIAACARNHCIGKDGRIPWHISGEQRRFRDLTMGSAVIMGRRSFEEIGHALPGRKVIVLSRAQSFEGKGCLTARSLGEALRLSGKLDAYISGGAAVYAEALPLASRLYLTEIDASFEGDRFFPAFDSTQYIRVVDGFFPGKVPYSYVTYIRKY